MDIEENARMTFASTKLDPVPAILRSKGLLIRAASMLASVLGLILPVVTSSAMGITQSVNMLQITEWSVIAPIAVLVAILLPGLAPDYGRLGDVIAAVIALVILMYAGYVAFDAWNQVSQITGATTGILRDMAGNNPELQAYAGSYGQAFGFSVLPGLGLVAMMSAVVLTIIQVVRPRL